MSLVEFSWPDLMTMDSGLTEYLSADLSLIKLTSLIPDSIKISNLMDSSNSDDNISKMIAKVCINPLFI